MWRKSSFDFGSRLRALVVKGKWTSEHDVSQDVYIYIYIYTHICKSEVLKNLYHLFSVFLPIKVVTILFIDYSIIVKCFLPDNFTEYIMVLLKLYVSVL